MDTSPLPEPWDWLDEVQDWFSSNPKLFGVLTLTVLFLGATSIYLYILLIQDTEDVFASVQFLDEAKLVVIHKKSVTPNNSDQNFKIRFIPQQEATYEMAVEVKLLEKSPQYTSVKNPFVKKYLIGPSMHEMDDTVQFSVGAPPFGIQKVEFDLQITVANNKPFIIPLKVEIQRLSKEWPLGVAIMSVLTLIITFSGQKILEFVAGLITRLIGK